MGFERNEDEKSSEISAFSSRNPSSSLSSSPMSSVRESFTMEEEMLLVDGGVVGSFECKDAVEDAGEDGSAAILRLNIGSITLFVVVDVVVAAEKEDVAAEPCLFRLGSRVVVCAIAAIDSLGFKK